jgi:uncharacterized membrane protein
LRKIGGLLLVSGTVILIVWGLYQWFQELFPSLHIIIRLAIIAVFLGLCILMVSLIRERIKNAKEETARFKEVEK